MKHGINLHTKNQHTLIIALIISFCILTIIVIFMFLPSVVVKEEDITAPAISLNDSSHMIVAYGSNFTDPGASAIDNTDGDLTASIIVEGSSVNLKLSLDIEKTVTADNEQNEEDFW